MGFYVGHRSTAGPSTASASRPKEKSLRIERRFVLISEGEQGTVRIDNLRVARSSGVGDSKRVGQIVGANRAAFANDHRTLDDVAQLANVAGPRVSL